MQRQRISAKPATTRDGNLRPPGAGQVDVWLAPTEYPEPGTAAQWRAWLSDSELARLDRLAVQSAQRVFLCSHALLRRALAAYRGLPPQRLVFATTETGRPELVDGEGLRFNLSHTSGLAAVAVASDTAVGIDLEDTAREPLEVGHIAGGYFAPSERELVDRADPPGSVFFDLWTLKEACLKAMGLGLTVPLEQVVFDVSGDQPTAQFDPALGEDAAMWSFALLEVTERHRLALALRHPNLVVRQVGYF